MGCSKGKQGEFKKDYYNKSEQEWVTSLAKLEFKQNSLRNQVLLVTNATECTVCLQELEWWNLYGNKQEGINVSLIIIEKYKKVFKTFS